MKKVLGLALTALLTMTMCMSVFAAGSSTVKTVTEQSVSNNANGTRSSIVESVTGTKVAVVTSAATTTSQGVVTSAAIATGDGAVLAFTDASGKKIDNVVLAISAASDEVISNVLKGAVTGTAVNAAQVAAAINIDVDGFTSGSATLPLKVNNVVKGEPVYGIHIKADGTVEYVPAVASENGVVIITLSSFSPVIIVKGQVPATAASTATTATTEAATTSPKTGETAPAALLLAAACLAGAFVCAKRISYSK